MKFFIEMVTYFGLALVTSGLTLLCRRTWRTGERAMKATVLFGATGLTLALIEIWAQFSHRERFAQSTIVGCIVIAVIATVLIARTTTEDRE